MSKERGKLSIQVSDGDTANDGLASRLLDNFTPKSRKVARLPQSEVKWLTSFQHEMITQDRSQKGLTRKCVECAVAKGSI